MAQFEAVVTWIDARERLPHRDGWPVTVATAGHYPPESREERDRGGGQAYWLVRPMVFATSRVCGAGVVHRNSFFDSDGYAYAAEAEDEDGSERHDCAAVPGEPGTEGYAVVGDERVTHWAELPAVPGGTAHALVGEAARSALRRARGAGSAG
ncbi:MULTISPECIES: AQJ64_40280 family protein [Streptomyces]|uniref:AQJ64_40280 family protein n=1 Tax=Streptomyces ramulosus TaxID=47762 RepID=A0ABW1FQT2_9ACTN